MLWKKLSDLGVQNKREGAGLDCFSDNRTTAVGGKINSNPDSSYIFVA